PRPPPPTLFPYTTLFRSRRVPARDQLRAAGLRVTAPRVAVLEWLADHPHATAEQVAAGVRDVLGSVSTQAIYDVLGACTNANLRSEEHTSELQSRENLVC